MTASRFGPLIGRDATTFRLWAPTAREVALVGDRVTPMNSARGGWFELQMQGVGAGFRYQFRIDHELDVPDPASHFQPQDVGGSSEVIDHTFPWQCTNWIGRPWHETVLLELHVGTFTQGGTFRAAQERLDDLAELGITAIELMPIGDFSGCRNWGYDGVLLYAPDSAYGRPEDLKSLVDAAHRRGLMVFLDVVYNHFGPEGNYLGRYASPFFTPEHTTPWGDAIDFRVPQVREFMIDNALHWLSQYRFDGLRLDAVHALAEPGEPSVLTAISAAVGRFAAASGRHIHLVLENDDNRASLLDPAMAVAAGQYRAQWNDDYHHAWHVLLTNETRGYYADYAEDPRSLIARSLAEGFVHQGQLSKHRGRPRGESSKGLPPAAFVNFLQNHDQIGNRAYGERLTALAQPEAVAAALQVLLLAPQIPMLFMGEEWGAGQPFPFFCDFAGDLGEAVRRGRAAEFAEQFAGAAMRGDPPDPLVSETFDSAILDWAQRLERPYAARLDLVRALLATRRRLITPLSAPPNAIGSSAVAEDALVRATWTMRGDTTLSLIANLSGLPVRRPDDMPSGCRIWGRDPPPVLPPWSVYWSLGAA